ncbi:hypothetical protein PsAD5_04009 [Pseudovibrio sp. Ad5]|nr:hypothetical protein PsAD5_04009 [Pseudovibrio sp. Ad5]
MGQGTRTASAAPEKVVKDIRRKTRKRYSIGEKIHIVLVGLQGEERYRRVMSTRRYLTRTLL